VYSPEVARAKADDGPIVALESTLIAHGLPSPQNLAAVRNNVDLGVEIAVAWHHRSTR
jgi:pseudouridine-5'-phosphate glycosidase